MKNKTQKQNQPQLPSEPVEDDWISKIESMSDEDFDKWISELEEPQDKSSTIDRRWLLMSILSVIEMKATVRLLFVRRYYDGNTFCVLLDIDSHETYAVKSTWIPKAVDSD